MKTTEVELKLNGYPSSVTLHLDTGYLTFYAPVIETSGPVNKWLCRLTCEETKDLRDFLNAHSVPDVGTPTKDVPTELQKWILKDGIWWFLFPGGHMAVSKIEATRYVKQAYPAVFCLSNETTYHEAVSEYDAKVWCGLQHADHVAAKSKEALKLRIADVKNAPIG